MARPDAGIGRWFSAGLRAHRPVVPGQDIAGLPAILSHQYDNVDLDEVSETAIRDVPRLLSYKTSPCASQASAESAIRSVGARRRQRPTIVEEPSAMPHPWLALLAALAAFVALVLDGPPTASARQEADRPEQVDGRYRLPSGPTTVIHAVANNGSVPPQYQRGFEVTIAATGWATVVVTPEGALASLATPTAEQTTFVVELGEDGLQRLLGRMAELGFYELAAEAAEAEGPLRVGGPVSLVTVTLADGTWETFNGDLPDEAWPRLNAVQAAIVAAVGLPTGEGDDLVATVVEAVGMGTPIGGTPVP